MCANFVFGAASLDAGVRYVRTEQSASGYAVENANLATQRITPVSFSNTYSMLLPAAGLRYELTSKVLLRSAYSKTLTRPDLNQMAPSETVSGIGQADGVIVTGPIPFTQPINGVSAKVNGAELSAQSRFTLLPAGWLRNFGAIVNYTYAKSSAHFSVIGDVRSAGLPGLSKNSYNASVYYDDGRFESRLSYAWRGNYLANFSDDFEVPRFRQQYGQYDLSASYKVAPHLSLQRDVLNLSKSQFVDTSSAKFYPYGVTDLDRRILVGARYAMRLR